MENDINNTHHLEKKFGRLFFLSVATVFAFFILLRFLVKNSGVVVPVGILFFGFFITVYTAYLLSKTNYDFTKLYRILTAFLAIFICYVSLLISDISRAIQFLFVPLVLMIMLTSKFSKTVLWSIIFLLFSMLSSKIAAYFQIGIRKDFFKNKPETLLFQEYIVITISSYFSFLIIYYHNEFSKFEKREQEIITENAPEDVVTIQTDIYSTIDINIKTDPADKDQILYSRIILYFEEEKPYQKADFNIRKLAESLDSNSTYVSRALNKIGNKKFNQLVNDYRINQVKAEIANNLHQKFTLEHIYTSAGFSQQSTFNRIFKENTGSTPSEYIDNIQQIR